MSFNDDYMALRKKRLEEEAKKNPRITGKYTGVVLPSSPADDKESDGWFQGGAFDDGYQFGDVSKTILGTVTDVAENVGSSILGMGEKVVDTFATIAPIFAEAQWNANGGFYNQEATKAFKEMNEAGKTELQKFVEKDLYDEEAIAKNIISAPIHSLTGVDAETDSVFGQKSDSLIQSAGQLGATAALQAVGVPWFLTTGVTTFGSEAENAFRQGASYDEALLSSTISAGAEILTEKIAGISFGGKTWTDAMTNTFAANISNKTMQALAKLGVDAVGEGGEEILSGVMSAIGQKITYASEKEFSELFSSEEAFESFIGGLVLGGGANIIGNVRANAKGEDAVTGLHEYEQRVVDRVYKDAVAEAEEGGKKLSAAEKTKLYEETLNRLEKGYIDVDTIEETLGDDVYKSYKDTIDYEDDILKQYEEIGNKQNPTLADQSLYAELQSQVKDIKENSQREYLKENLSNEVFNKVKDSKLAESYNEKARRQQAFEADLSQYDAKQQETIKKAVESGILNNTNRTHEFVDMVSKISADKGVLFGFTNNEKLKETGFALEGKEVNGFVTNDGVTLNIDSHKALQSTVGHEITHVLEGTELYAEMQKALFEYAKSRNDYQGRYDTLTELYKDVEGANIDAELAADLVGDYLFTDEDFVKHLSTQNRNVFQKIYDEIKYLWKVATAGSKEARELEKVKNLVEKVYKESATNEKPTGDADIRFSLSKSVEESGELMALHNLKSNELLKSLDLGGMPMPSIAIIKAEAGHEQYGDISLVFPKETIDPQVSRDNKVYGGDAWTPTYPRMEYKASEDVAKRIRDKYYAMESEYGHNKVRPLYDYVYELDNALTRSGGEAALKEELYDDTRMMQVYLLDSKGEIQTVTKEIRTELTDHEVSMYEFLAQKLGSEVIDGVNQTWLGSPIEQRKAYWENNGNAIKEAYGEFLAKEFGFAEEDIQNVLSNMKTADFLKVMRDAKKYQTNGRVTIKTEEDPTATQEAIREAAGEGYKAWVDDLFTGSEEKVGIRNNVDAFTRNGNRRGWDALHWENTLENVVKAMKQQDQTGSEAVFGVHKFFAASSKNYKSIAEIKADADRLHKISDGDYEAAKDAFESRFTEIAKKVMDKKESNQFIAMDNAMECIVDAVRQSKTKADIYNELKQYQQLTVTESDVDDIVSLVTDISNMPTGYFEAKPMRAVGFDEVGVFVIPRNADVKLKQELLNRGYAIAEYDPDVEGDRQKVVNSFEEYKFSLSDVNAPQKRYGNYNIYGKDVRLEAPMQEDVAENATTTPIAPVEDAKTETPVALPDEFAPIPEAEANALQSENVDSLTDADAYAPQEDIAPVKEQYEAIRPKREKSGEPRMKRVDAKSARGNQRKWIGTSTDSEAVDGKVKPEDIPDDMRYYQPIPNKVTLGNANSRLNSMGYDSAISYFNSQFANKRVSLDDIALGERLIQEAVKRGDTKTASELIQNVAILGTELGQKVQALSIIKRLTPEGQLRMLQKTVERGKTKGDKSFEGVEITQEMIDHILKTYGKDGTYDQTKLNEAVEDVKKKIANQMKVTKLEKVNAWRYLSMLGNPKTHIRNFFSNVAMRGTVAVKNALARTIESVAPIGERTKTWKRATDAVKTFSQKTAVEMKDVLSDGGKYSEEASIKAKRDTFKNKILNSAYNFNSDLLSKEDWWFSKPAFTNALSEYLTANGIKTEQDIKNNPKIVSKAKQYATEQSQIATFRQYSWLANKINEIEHKNTATSVAVGAVLPFKKTPINIAKTGLAYSPLGFTKTLTYDIAQVKNGKMEASELVDHLSQNITGTALTLVGYMLASSGFLNGAGEDDKEGKYDYQLGEQAYSINIGDATFSLSWLSPIAMPLFVGANAYEQLVEGKEWNGDVVMETLAQTLDPLSEMSFLSSLDSVLSSYDSGIQKFAGIAQSAAQSYITQFVPTLSSQVAAVMDDTKRTTKVAGDSDFKFVDETINNLKYKIPFLRQTLEPTTDIWGNDVKQTENGLTRAFETFIAPYSKREDIATEIDSEIKSLYSMTGDDGLIPSIPYNYVNYKNEKYEMSAKEYTAYKETYGQTAYNLLGELFDTETYRYASDEDKAEMVNKVYDYARDVAKKALLAKNGVDYTNATEDGEAYYRENDIKGAIEHDMTVDEYSFYREYPEKYAVAKSVGGYEKYKTYSSELYDIKADKDESGKSITGSRKEKVVEYVNNLDIDYGERLILFKSEYPADDTYNAEIVEYLNNRQDISYEDMVTILKELGFTVKGNTVTWD